MTEHPPATTAHSGKEPGDRPAAVLIAQFFLVPLLIIGGVVAVFVLVFTMLTAERRTALDYLDEVQTGHYNRRWQAAFELSRHLAAVRPEERDALGRRMIEVLKESGDDDPRVRRYLVTALGTLGEPAAVPVLLDALEDADPETRFNAVIALGRIGDRRAVPALIGAMDSTDPGVRIAAAGVLGALGDERAVRRLQGALHDSREDVRWNAAIALSRLGEESAVPQLRRMLDRRYLVRVPDATPSQQEAALVEAIHALDRLGAEASAGVLDDLRRLAREDPSPAVRQAAMESLR